jgi:hypothetical protein
LIFYYFDQLIDQAIVLFVIVYNCSFFYTGK